MKKIVMISTVILLILVSFSSLNNQEYGPYPEQGKEGTEAREHRLSERGSDTISDSINPFFQLTDTPETEESIVSFDGNNIIYRVSYETTYNIFDVTNPLVHVTLDMSDSVNSPDIDGNRIAYSDSRDGDHDIYLYDMGSDNSFMTADDGGETQITNDTYDQGGFYGGPRIAGDLIVWPDMRHGDSDGSGSINGIVYAYNIANGSAFRVSSLSANARAVVTDGRYVVWEDFRDQWGQIYYFDTQNPGVRQLTDSLDGANRPAMDSGRVAWIDWSEPMSVMVHDFSTGDTRDLFHSPPGGWDTAFYVDIHGDYATWNLEENGIWLCHIPTRISTRISPQKGFCYNIWGEPLISGNKIVWAAMAEPDNWDLKDDIYMFDLDQGFVGLANNYAAVADSTNLWIIDRWNQEWVNFPDPTLGQISVRESGVLWRDGPQFRYYTKEHFSTTGATTDTTVGTGDGVYMSNNLTMIQDSSSITWYKPSTREFETDYLSGTLWIGDPYAFLNDTSGPRIYNPASETWIQSTGTGTWTLYFHPMGTILVGTDHTTVFDMISGTSSDIPVTGMVSDWGGRVVSVSTKDQIQVYDFTDHSWYQKTFTSTGHYPNVRISGNILLFNTSSAGWVYDTATHSWLETPSGLPLPSNRKVVEDNIVAVWGQDTTYIYDIFGKSDWTTLAKGNRSVQLFDTFAFRYDASTPSLDLYRTDSGSWSSVSIGSSSFDGYWKTGIIESATSTSIYDWVDDTWNDVGVTGEFKGPCDGNFKVLMSDSNTYAWGTLNREWVENPSNTGILHCSNDIVLLRTSANTYAWDTGTGSWAVNTGNGSDYHVGTNFGWYTYASQGHFYSAGDHAWQNLGNGQGIASDGILLWIKSVSTDAFFTTAKQDGGDGGDGGDITDGDADGLPDDWEAANGLDNTTDDSALDADADGLTNLAEYLNGTNPQNIDTDGDGMPDGWEVEHGFDPLSSLDASQDLDMDGFTNLEEYEYGSDPTDAGSHPPVPAEGEVTEEISSDTVKEVELSTDAGDPIASLKVSGNGTLTVKSQGWGNVSSEVGDIPSDQRHIGIFLDIDLETVDWINISVPYDEATLPENVTEESLALYYWDAASSEWREAENSWVDTDANVIYANLTHLTVFAAFGDITIPDGEDGENGGNGDGTDGKDGTDGEDGEDGDEGGLGGLLGNPVILIGIVLLIVVIIVVAVVASRKKKEKPAEESPSAMSYEEPPPGTTDSWAPAPVPEEQKEKKPKPPPAREPEDVLSEQELFEKGREEEPSSKHKPSDVIKDPEAEPEDELEEAWK